MPEIRAMQVSHTFSLVNLVRSSSRRLECWQRRAKLDVGRIPNESRTAIKSFPHLCVCVYVCVSCAGLAIGLLAWLVVVVAGRGLACCLTGRLV